MKRTLIFTGIVLGVGSFLLLPDTQNSRISKNSQFRRPAQAKPNKEALRPARNASTMPTGKNAENETAALRENASLEEMTRVLSLYTQSNYNLPSLIDYLKRNGEQPFVARDTNPYTGEMIIVRTKAPLPGTRYFHAQYFTSENGQPTPQHMSFEYKPGPTALNDAAAAVEKAFTNLPRPSITRPDFIQWNLDQDHIVWIKRMGTEDLRDDPFNAYTAADSGTVRVAIELEIHDKEESQ
jgi:uncharacterized Rmd1/YagE family protein